MKNLASFSMIHKRVCKIKEQLNLEHLGSAFDRLSLKIILRLNEDEIEESLTDGANDCGIDAIYISEKTIHFCNCKYGYDIDQTDKNFPGTEIEKLISTVSLIMQSNIERSSVNDALWDKYLEIRNAFLEGSVNQIKIHLISNKMKPTISDQNKIESALSRYRLIDVKYYDLDDLVNHLLLSNEEAINSNILLLDDQHFEKSDGSLKTIVGVVAAEDYLKMLTNKNNNTELIESAFNDNVRLYKPKHSVNKAIIDSALSEHNHQFFYLNNGVTIICEDCTYVPHVRNQNITLKNIQVINGGQTTHSLFEAYKKDKEKVSKVDILIRICVTKKDSQLAEQISESSNNQIPIGSRDLKANDLIQKKLQDEFTSLGYFYERKNNQFVDEDHDKVLSNELLAQLYLSYELGKPSEAKNNKSRIFGDMYEAIFDEEKISAEILLKLHKIYLPLSTKKKEIQNLKRKKELINEKDAFVSRAIFHIIYGVKLFITKENKSIDNQNDIDEAIEKSIKAVSYLVDIEMSKRGQLYTHDKYFKETSTNTQLSDYIAEL